MKLIPGIVGLLLLGAMYCGQAAESVPDRDAMILVTFTNSGATLISGRIRAPYQARRRYAMAAQARRHADEVAAEYGLVQEDHWPIKALDIYCFVYRIGNAEDREELLRRLEVDDRVESAQALNRFETSAATNDAYDDTYVHLQHGLADLDVASVHVVTRGSGIRVAIVDSHVDTGHEDLKGQINNVRRFTDAKHESDAAHGTAVASVIGAVANNATGIVGVAPESKLDVLVSCWLAGDSGKAVCDSFTLAKALDRLLDDPPDVLNLSLVGPEDRLVERLIRRAADAGVIVIAASPVVESGRIAFPASIDVVIAAGNAHRNQMEETRVRTVLAPGDQIMVALPDDNYDFRSGSSLAAAHVSGVVALLLAVDPLLGRDQVARILNNSGVRSGVRSIDACHALGLAGVSINCLSDKNWLSKLQPGTE